MTARCSEELASSLSEAKEKHETELFQDFTVTARCNGAVGPGFPTDAVAAGLVCPSFCADVAAAGLACPSTDAETVAARLACQGARCQFP